MLEEVKMDGSESKVAGGRQPLEIKAGKKFRVGIRGGGTYKTVDAKDFKTGQTMAGIKLESAAIVVCNPDDPEEEYTVSGIVAPNPTTWGKSVQSLLEKDDDGVYWLKKDLLNTIGWIGKVEQESSKGYDKKMAFLTWDPVVDKKGEPVLVEDAPDEPASVGSAQRIGLELEETDGGEIEI